MSESVKKFLRLWRSREWIICSIDKILVGGGNADLGACRSWFRSQGRRQDATAHTLRPAAGSLA